MKRFSLTAVLSSPYYLQMAFEIAPVGSLTGVLFLVNFLKYQKPPQLRVATLFGSGKIAIFSWEAENSGLNL